MKKFFGLPVAIGCSLFLANQSSNSRASNNFFSSKSDKETKTSKSLTKTYIWGNGNYQPRPDALLKFLNFEPKLIRSFLGPNNCNFKDLTFGEFHEGGIDVDGNIYVWKKRVLDASLSHSENDDKRTDIILLDNDRNAVQMTFTKGFVWALKSNGDVYQWRVDIKIDPDTEEPQANVNLTPRKVDLLKDITQISAGEDHFVALDKNGEIWTMGDDTLGQCGLGDVKRSSSPPFFAKRVKIPRKIPGLSNIRKVVAGGNHTLALTNEGVVLGWGSNSLLQLSHEAEFSAVDSPLLAVFSPIKIDKNLGPNFVTDIAAGSEFSMFVTRNRFNNHTEVYGCGHNLQGQLGCGNLAHISDVKKVESLSNYTISTPEGEKDVGVKQIVCGDNHCIALLSVGAVLEWGANEYGQLGNRKRVFSENPIIVSDFTEENVLKIAARHNNTGVIAEYSEKLEEEKKKRAEEKKMKKATKGK